MLKNFIRALEIMPLGLAVFVAAFGTVAMAMLLLGWLNNLVWPLGITAGTLAFALLWRWLPPSQANRETIICNSLVIVGVLLWGIFNAFYTSEHMLTNRDPATYANAAIWLINHEDLKIDTPNIFGQNPNITIESPGFMSFGQNDVVFAQGQHLFPVLIGLIGRLVGSSIVLHSPVLFGVLALLAVYRFARLLVRPRWALLATATLAFTLPLLYFARDTYTEPLSLMLIFSAMTLLWYANKTMNLGLWGLAGFVAGANVLTRIDSYVVLAGFLVFIAVFLATRPPLARSKALKAAGLFIGVSFVFATLGFTDLLLLSPHYFANHQPLISQVLLGILVILFLGIASVFLAWRTKLLSVFISKTQNWQQLGIFLLVSLTALVIASRPLWFTDYINVQSDFITGVQFSHGEPLTPRGYTELSSNWLAWYVGPIIAALGVVGLAWAAVRSLRNQNYVLLIGFFVVSLTAIVYLLKPSIAPDQIWAARRFLPVVIPGIIVFGALAAQSLSDKLLKTRIQQNIIFVLVAAVFLLGPLLTSRPFLLTRDTAQLPLISKFCEVLPKNAAVLWIGESANYTVQPTRSFCQKPAYGYKNREINQKELAKAATAARTAGYTPIIGLLSGDVSLIDKQNITEVVLHYYLELEPTLESPPKTVHIKQLTVLAGELKDDGTIVKLGSVHEGK